MEKILITGGTGLIGTQLTQQLLDLNYEIVHLTRSKNSRFPIRTYEWDIRKGIIEAGALEGVHHIIHLAGESIAAKRWSEEQKKRLFSSRIDSAALLYQYAQKEQSPLKTFISASGINIYGTKTSEHTFTEEDQPENDFLAELTIAWEKAADEFSEKCRVVKLRTGVVLAKDGGALDKISKPIKFGVGAPLGSGKQYIPWIHIDDIVEMYIHALQQETVQGAYNAVAPSPVTNKELTQKIAKTLKRPLFLPPIPGFILKLMLGEMADLVLEGIKASPDKIKQSGFEFKYTAVEEALEEIYK